MNQSEELKSILEKFPEANATIGEDEMIRRRDVERAELLKSALEIVSKPPKSHKVWSGSINVELLYGQLECKREHCAWLVDVLKSKGYNLTRYVVDGWGFHWVVIEVEKRG